MTRFPSRLKHGSNEYVELDPARLLLAFRESIDREAIDRMLSELGFDLEEAPGDEAAGARGMQRINHTDTRYWVRSIAGVKIDDDRLVRMRSAFDGALDWIGPVYRSRREPAAAALFCPLPNVLVVRQTPAGVNGSRGQDRTLRAVSAEARGAKLHEEPEKSKYLPGFRYYVIDNPAEYDAYQLRDQLLTSQQEGLLDIQLESMPMLVPSAVVPNDTLYAQQWNMTRIEAPAGWDISTGNAAQVICVLDEGCDLTHPDLQFAATGINLGTMSGDGSPTGPHGTACAGVAAATFNNSAGVAGVAGSCHILPLAFQNWTDVEVAAGITYATAHSARVISMSFGWDAWSHAIIDPAIQAAFNSDIVMCVATHNHNGPITYPATNPLVIAVGASDEADNRKSPTSPDGEGWGSDFGPQIAVVAPGVHIPTSDIQGAGGYVSGDYTSVFNGTSAATPHVAGLAGLVRSAYPSLTNVEVRAIIERTAEKVGPAYADTPGHPNGTWNQEMGYGRINVRRALDSADAMIRDWPGDTGVEPSSPPSGNFWDFGDIVVRIFDDNVFVPSDPGQSKFLELGQTNHLYVRVTNRGPRAARNVMVSARITPFVGTQFVYPTDWTAVDATHLSPTPVNATFPTVPAGGEVIAKFTISAAQVAILHSNSWHPCLVASVTADNDYAFASASLSGSPIVVRRNNLAQRNLSVINVLAGAMATFPFMAGHPENREGALEIVVDRLALPDASTLLLALDEENDYFPAVELVDRPGDGHSDDGMVFLDGARIRTRLGCCEGVLTLAKGSRFDCAQRQRVGKVTVEGGEVVLRDGKRYVDVRERSAVVRIAKAAGAMLPLALQAQIPAQAGERETYRLSVAQRDERQEVVGGASVIFQVS
jgi:hypothetical protein